MTDKIISEDDLGKIQTVLQLPEHVNTTTLTIGSVNSEDEPLVSFDELYEKTGQESIQKIIKGFDSILKNNKLSKVNTDAIKMTGTENFVPGYDKRNAVNGSEGFFSKVKDGLVYIVKAIVGFINGIYNWIVDRVKILLGFGKTAKEVDFLNENTDEINVLMAKLLKEFGDSSLYDPAEMYKVLPKGFTDTETLTFIKSKLLSNTESIERLSEISPKFDKIVDKINQYYDNTHKAKNTIERVMNKFRSNARNGRLTEADLLDLTNEINKATVMLDLTSINEMTSSLLEELYGIEIKDIGVETEFKKIQEKRKEQIEKVRVTFNKDILKTINTLVKRSVYTTMGKRKGDGRTHLDSKLALDALKQLKGLVNEPDSVLIQGISISIPNSVSAKNLPALYLNFSNTVSRCITSLDVVLESLNEIQTSTFSLIKWYHKTVSLITAYITRDIKEILNAHKKYLTEQEIKNSNLEGEKEINGNFVTVPKYLMELDVAFHEKYPDWNIPETISQVNQTLIQAEQIANPLKTFASNFKKS